MNNKKKIGAYEDLLHLLEKIVQVGRPVLLIAGDVGGVALVTLVVNKLRGTLVAVAVKAPAFGDRRKAILQDIATLIGGQVISEDVGMKLENTDIKMLGRARQVKVRKEEAIIVGGGTVLVTAAKTLEKVDAAGDEAMGVAIVRRALEEPARQLALNAGQEGSIIVEQMRQQAAGRGWERPV